MGANVRLRTLSDCIRHKANLKVDCACGNKQVLCSTALWRVCMIRPWNEHLEGFGVHLRCSRCKGTPERIGPTMQSPTVKFGPQSEYEWKRLMRRARK